MDLFDPEKEIPIIARKHHRHTDVITLDDLIQEMWLEWCSDPDYRERATQNQLRGWMVRVAKTAAQKERVDYMHFTGQFEYTPGMVRNLLETAVFAAGEDCRDQDARLDVLVELRRLPYKQREAVFKRYATNTRLSGTETSRVSRAVDTITIRLNEKLPTIRTVQQ